MILYQTCLTFILSLQLREFALERLEKLFHIEQYVFMPRQVYLMRNKIMFEWVIFIYFAVIMDLVKFSYVLRLSS